MNRPITIDSAETVRAEADRPHDRAAHEQIADAGEDCHRKPGQDVAVAGEPRRMGEIDNPEPMQELRRRCIRQTRRNPRTPAHEPRPQPDARQSSDAGEPRPAESAAAGGRGGRRKTCWARPESGGRASPPAPRRRRWTATSSSQRTRVPIKRSTQTSRSPQRTTFICASATSASDVVRPSGRRSSPGPPRTGRRRCRNRRSRKSARRDPC